MLVMFTFIKTGWIDLCPVMKEKSTSQFSGDKTDSFGLSQNWPETLAFSLGVKRIILTGKMRGGQP